MSALKKALTDLRFRVPPQILNAIFLNQNQDWTRAPVSLDEAIMSKVIRPRVMMDCDIVGGTDVLIDISNLPSERMDVTSWVMRVPKTLTQNRSIISVQGITTVRPDNRAFMTTPMANTGAMMMAGNALLQTNMIPPAIFNHRLDLIGENVILISETSYLQPNMYLHCMLGSDEQLSHIKMRYWIKFSRLVELAVKSFIYNEYIVEMDMFELRGGQAMGRFKEIIDSWNDSEQEYQLFLAEKWKKSSMQNDERAHDRYIKALIGTDR